MEKRALGKGLSALIPEKEESAVANQNITFLKTEDIQDNSKQPRTKYDQERLNALKVSIEEQGILQPILVRPKNNGYEVIAGERRLKAARALNLPQVPVVIKDVSDQQAFVIALIENIQREELNPIEEAQGYQKLMDEFQYTQEAIAKSVGKDRSTVTNLLRLLKLSDAIKAAVSEGKISVGHARTLLSVESDIERNMLFEILLHKEMSVRELENVIQLKGKGFSRREKKQKTKPNDVLLIEESLQKFLGTKVRIEGKKKRGKIVIDFYSLEDLDRIIRVMIKKENI